MMLHSVKSKLRVSLLIISILVSIVPVILIPPEKTLGSLVRLVFFHGALAQTGLIFFGVTGLASIIYLFTRKQIFIKGCLALQKTSLFVWIVYAVSCILVTWLAWGVPVAWDEPRVQASAHILLISLVFAGVTSWIRQPVFTASVNIIMAVAAWYLVKNAHVVRHPLDPVGSSQVLSFKFYFFTLTSIYLVIAAQIAALFFVKNKQL